MPHKHLHYKAVALKCMMSCCSRDWCFGEQMLGSVLPELWKIYKALNQRSMLGRLILD